MGNWTVGIVRGSHRWSASASSSFVRSLDSTGQYTSFYDLNRVEDDKIAELWDVVVPIEEDSKTSNSNGKF
ncbi:hypothetical protein DAT300_16460 [Streptococcus suis]|nr:hypothetical protein DAT300_16460 [Streptococcus suis]